MKDPIELRPCPFCMGAAESDRNRHFITYNNKSGTSVAIYCTKCVADMCMCREDYPDQTTEELFHSLVEQWNRRTPDESGTAYGWQKGMRQAAEICMEHEEVNPGGKCMAELIDKSMNTVIEEL